MVSTTIHGNEYKAECAQFLKECDSFSVRIEARRANGCPYSGEQATVILFADDPMKFVELGQQLAHMGLQLCEKKEKAHGAPAAEAKAG
jgi:hypothetical protein